MARRGFLATLAVSAALAGCGGSGSSTTTSADMPGGANSADVAVIKAWADALRAGNIQTAAGYFAIPSVAENGPILLHIHGAEEARRFNESLPCGAILIRAQSAGEFTTATFRLTERPGPGVCGPGAGTTAETSFVIRDGKIAQWRRVGVGGGGETAPSEST